MLPQGLFFQNDFENLTDRDIDKIIKLLQEDGVEIDIKENEDLKQYLFDVYKNNIFNNAKVSTIIENKVFAGRTSVKWYRFNAFNKEVIKEKLELKENFFEQKNNIEANELNGIEIQISSKITKDKYMVRLIMPGKKHKINRGTSIESVLSAYNIITYIDLREEYIEVRTSMKLSKSIINFFENRFLISEIEEIDILGQYGNSIEKFKNSLNNARISGVKSMPSINLSLSEKQNEAIFSLFQILDEVFVTKDIEIFINEFKNVDLSLFEGIPLSQLMIAETGNIEIDSNDDVVDLSNQTLYRSIKEHINENSGYIIFNDENDNDRYTIKVGIKANSIYFVTYATEEIIKYIRGKVFKSEVQKKL